MRNDDDRRWLYDQMKKAGVDTGTYDDFTNSLNNPEDRDWYYNKSKSLGLEVGSSDDFISMMVADQEVPNTPNNPNTLNNQNTPKEKVEEIQPVETGDTTSGVLGNDTLSAMQEIGTPLQQQRDSLNDLEGHTDNYYRAQDDWKKQREEQRNATKDWYENQGGKEQTEAMQSQAEALVEQNKSGAQRFFDRRVEEGNVLAWMLGGVADIVNRWTNDDYGNARVVQERIEDTKNLIEEAERKVTTGEGQQLLASLRGAWNSAADIRTWDFGANDATDIFNIGQALKKADQKQELTPSEEMLLNAVALTSELEDAYGEDVSMGYRVGQSVPQSAGFYTTIALNPASGLGQSMAKAALRKYARTKFGPIGVRTIVNGTRFGGDALEALSTTITTGMPRTFNTVAERRIGQVMGAPMEDGTYQYIGHKSKDDSFAESAWKGFLSSYFENESEMLGEYLAPLKGFVGNMFARAAGDKAWAKKAVQWMTTSSDDEVTTLLNRMKGKAKINGLVGEYLEEVANNVADAAIIHDQNFSTDPNSKDWGDSVFNPEKNLETFLSVAAMIGPMKMVELGGRGYNQYSANQTLKAREQLMKDVYGKDNDNGQYIVDQFSECKDWKEMSQKFTQLKNEQMISDEREARAVLSYLSALVESQTVNTRYQSKKYHSERIGDQSKEAYDAGLGMKLQDYHKANLQYAPAKQQAHDMFGDDMAEAMVQMTPWEFNNVRMRMSPEQRQVAEAYYNQASRMKGILDKENADVNAHMDYFRNSYAPYVKRVANGDDFLMRAKYTDPLHPEAGSEDVVLLSRDGSTATILLNGKPSMVNTNTLSEFTSQTWREAQEEERNSFAKQKEQQRQWGLDHNPKTQMPYAGSTIKISSGEAGGGMSEYVTDFDMQNGMVGIVPMQFDAKAGQEVPLSTEVQQVPLEVILHLQDQYYDGLEGMSAQNTPSNPNTQNTPSEETEEGAGMAPGAAEAQLRGTQGGQQTLQQVQDWMNAGEDPETIERNIQTQIEEDYRDLALQYYREKSTPQAEPAGTVAGTPQAEPAGTVAGENGGEATAPTAPELRGKNGQLDRAMMEQNGDPQAVASALRGDFPDDAADIASEYQALAQQEADSETEPIAKRVKAKAAKFWQDVLNLLRPIAQGGPTAAEIRAQAQIEATEEAKKNFPKIVERWQNAPKKVGRKTIYRLPDGTRITGHYVLTESGAYTPSHDPHTFKPNEGFPTTDQGTTANSRDYEHDEAAQQQVVVMGQSYNGNALQDPVVVSQDGIVYSGNNRAMSGQLAAEQGTDTDYLEDLGIRAEEYGFTEEDIAGMQHPRVVFVADAGQDLDYTPKTFDRFNAQRGKGQSATEKAIKFGKILDETTFGNLVGVITKRNKLSDVYKSAEDCKAIADYLEAAGVMTSTQRVEFLDSKGLLTSQGQEALEGALIGYVFKGNEQVVRLLNQMPAVRRRIIGAINEIVTNRSLGEYSLDNELGDAIQLLYEADQSGMDLGSFYKQTDFTRDVQGLYNATTYLLATMLDGTSQKSLKDVLQSYNTGADTQVSNFGGLFGGMNRQELLEDILKALGYELRTRQGTGQEDTGGQAPSVEEGADEGVGENEDDNEDDNDDDDGGDDGGENNGPKGGGTGNNSVPLPTEGETGTTPPEGGGVTAGPTRPVVPPSTPPSGVSEKPRKPGKNATREEAQAYADATFGAGSARAKNFMRVWELTHKKSAPKPNRGQAPDDGMSRSEYISEEEESEELTPEEVNELRLAGMEIGEYFVVDEGKTKFADFFAEMVNNFGDNIRPYVGQIYLGIEASVPDEIVDQMDDVKTVRGYDINTPVEEETDNENGQDDDTNVLGSGNESEPTVAGGEGESTGEGGLLGTDTGDTGQDSGTGQGSDIQETPGTGEGGLGGSSESGPTTGGHSGRTDTGGRGGRRGSTHGERGTGGGTGTDNAPTGPRDVGRDPVAEAEQASYNEAAKALSKEGNIGFLKSLRDQYKAHLSELTDALERAKITGKLKAVIERLRELFKIQPKESADISQEKVNYVSASDPTGDHSIGCVVPSGAADAMQRALQKLEQAEGKDVRTFVRDELGYKTDDEMFSNFSTGKGTGLSGEQVDGVGLAIHAMKQGKGFIIGDMTGIGKGREAAALIRWGKKHGKRVLFVTERSSLFSDMFRDLTDIGSGDLLPFCVNAGESNANITDKDTGVVVVPKPSKTAMDALWQSESTDLPIDKKGRQYDFMMMSYSQAGSENRGNAKAKLAWIKEYAKDAIVILDESHNASGDSNRGNYFRDIVMGASGVTFLSATYAKRPDNMMLYALRSSMGDANMTRQAMIEAIDGFGVPMQEILASNLFQSGEMVRRERDFTGVDTHWLEPKDEYKEEDIEKCRRTADKTMDVVNAIIDFQRAYVDPLVRQLNEQYKTMNDVAALTGAPMTVVQNTPYSGQVSNILGLMVYGMKAEKAAEMAIEQIKAGKKPVIAVENTFGSYVDNIEGDIGHADFSVVLSKGIDFTLRYSIVKKTYNKSTKKYEITDRQVMDIESELTPEGQAALAYLKHRISEYRNDQNKVELSLSPIDLIKNRLAEAGYKCGEITGRSNTLVHDPVTQTYHKEALGASQKDGKRNARRFNGGSAASPLSKEETLDALVVNVAGATGISLHASSQFGDTRPRSMIILQPARNVNTEVQMRGRIDRTGQLHRGEYFYLTSPIPAEMKLTMMLKQKLASLDANSVGTEEVSSNRVDAQDMDNSYGDEVAKNFLLDHQAINAQLDHGLTYNNKTNEWEGHEGLLYDVLIGIQRLDCDTQEFVLNELQSRYAEHIEYLNQNGVNTLKSTTMNLEATTIDKAIFIKGKDDSADNEFAHDTIIERVSANVLKKPMRSEDIRKKMKSLDAFDEAGEIDPNYGERVRGKIQAAVQELNEARTTKGIEKIESKKAKAREANPKRDDQTDEEYEAMIDELPDVAELRDKVQNDLNAQRTDLAKQASAASRAATYLKPGRPYLVPLTDDIDSNAPMMYGRFIGFEVKSGRPRDIKAVFAVKDSRVMISIPVVNQSETISKIINDTRFDTELSSIGGDPYDSNIQEKDRLPAWNEWWDSMIPKNTGRQIRYIISGNILQACGSLGKYKGSIITFTRKDEETGEITVERGMLLAENFDPENFKVRTSITKEDVWDSYNEISDSLSAITVLREGDRMVVYFEKRPGDKKLSTHPVLTDDSFKALIIGDGVEPEGRNRLRAEVSEENVEAALDYLYKNYGLTKENLLVMPDSTDKPDKIVYTGRPYTEVIAEFSAKYNVASLYRTKSLLREKLKRLKMDLSNDLLKEQIKELVQLRQAYLRQKYESLDSNALAWEALVKDEDIAYWTKHESKEFREDAYNEQQAIIEELDARGIKGNTLHLTQGETSLDSIKDLFNQLNTNKTNKEIFDKVFEKVKQLNLTILLNEKIPNSTGGQTAGDLVEYNWKYMNADWITDQMKADTILHELIHTCTVYAVRCVENDLEHMLDSEMVAEVNELINIYEEIKDDPTFVHDGIKQYGTTNVLEMLTEAGSNESFRNDLKKVGLWSKIKSAILRFFGIRQNPNLSGGKQTDAYREIMERLDYLIENFNVKAYTDYWRGTGYGRYKSEKPRMSASGRFKTSDRSTQNTPNNPREVEQAVEETSQVLNTPIEILRNEQELEASDISAADKKVMRRKGKGMYDTKTGKVYIYLPHLRSADDARVTALHEIVGHKGLRQLFGEKDFDLLMARLFGLLPREARDLIMSRCRTEEDIPTEVDEYLAEMAELDENPSWWQKVVSAVKEFLRSKGLNIGLSENDVKYLLWQSRNQLKSGDLFTEAQRIRMRKKYGIGENDNDDDDPDGGGGGRYQGGRETPIFYSNARRAVEGIKQEKATPEQWLAMIQKAGGLKTGEDKWLGLSEWLKGQKVKSLTKQEVLEYIMANQIQVEEVGYGKSLFTKNSKANLESELKKGIAKGKPIDDILLRWDGEFEDDKWYAYHDKKFTIDEEGNIHVDDELLEPINDTRLQYTTRGLRNRREIALVVPTIKSWNQLDELHFGDAGKGRAVAWIRFGETTVENPEARKRFDDAEKAYDEFGGRMYDKYGASFSYHLNEQEKQEKRTLYTEVLNAKNALKDNPVRVLVIDEIQSKRHQEGREKGYIDLETKAKIERFKFLDNKLGIGFGLPNNEYEELQELRSQGIGRLSFDMRDAVPDAPFEKNWHELAMKRMLRYAAENGYDKIAWTKGEQQAERYDLKQVVESIQWKEKEGFKGVKIALADRPLGIILSVDKDGIIKRGDYGGEAFVGKPLSDVLGKDLAGKIMADEGEKHESNLVSSPGAYYTLSGDGLSIGGEGMKGFYDQMLPRFMDKYGKKWGVKTGEVELPHLEEAGRKMWSVDVTPEMKESVMQGQAMFKKEDGAEDINKRFNEQLDEYEDFEDEDPVGENTSRFSTGRSTTATANATARQWDKIVQSLSFGLAEVTVDYLHAVERFQKFLADKTGKAVLYTQDVYNAMLQLSSRNFIETKKFDEMFVTPLNLAILDLLGNKVLVKSWRKWAGTGKLDFEKNPELQALDRYVKMKHGVERNRDMSVRNVLIPRGQQAYQDALDAALKPYRDDLERIEQELENNESIIESLKQELQALRASRAGSSAIQAKKDELDRARETSARLRNERAEDRRMIRDITKHPHKYGLKTLSESIEDELRSWYEAAQQVKENARANGKSWRETQEALDKEALKIPDVVLEDYSGLSAMTGDGIVFTQKAYDEVEKYEFDKDADKLQHLWAAISAIADFSMLKQQESGLVGDGYFDQQKRRFDYFVPLRGWQEMTAEDVYEYVNEVNTELGNPVKAMKGRQSEAGNAFGSLLNVAYGSINHGNRNEALTKFYNLVQGHPTDIARISGGWLERIEDPDGGPDLWVAREVELDGTETEEEMIQKIDAFESEMQEKAENGDAMRDSQHGAKVPYRITKPGTLNQHQIRIHINGRTRIITIGANPRVTEALNGLLNPSISNNMFVQGWKKVKNIKAGLLTAMSINFAQGNLDRDTSFAMVNSYVRYGGAFAKAFAKHQGAYFLVSGVGARLKWAEMGHLLRLYNKNSLDESNPLHQQFKEFMDYGGATGYTFLVNMEQSKKKLEDSLRQLNRGALHPGTFAKAFRDFVELVTQSSELTNRFSAFQAGKDLGWTRGQCIAAAKEITANFNRKGAGTKGARKNDENKARQKAVNLAASATDAGNALNLFFNASIQGKYALWLALKSHPAKGAAVAIGVPIALGMLMPLVNDMFLPMLYTAFGWDDYPPEDENYWDFNDYNRQHNIRIRLPKKLNILGHQTPKGWLKFSISQELTPFFSVGDVIAGSMYGGRELQASDLVQPFVDLVSPVNVNVDKMNGVKGVLRDMAGGTPFSEIVDVGLNKDFMGRPVYKETYNKQQAMAPNYTKGLKRTSPALTDFTKWLNNKSGGNEVKAGKVNINPAIAEHLSGALGGYFKLPMDFIDMAYAGYKGEELKGSFLENTALFKRNYDSGAQDAVDRRVSGKYYELVDAMDKLHYEEKGYEKAQREANQKANSSTDSYVQAEELSKADKMRAERDKLVSSDDYQFYISIKREMDFIKKLEDQEKKTGITNETIPEKKRALLEQWKEWKKR